MTNMQAVFQMVNALKPEEQQQLHDFLDDLLQYPAQGEALSEEPRILGLHAGRAEYWMSEDFDAELPDEFWGFNKDLECCVLNDAKTCDKLRS